MSIRKLFDVSSLVLGIGVSSTCAAIELYTCKISPASPMVGGVRTGVLENQTGRPLGSCTGRVGWRAGAKTIIPESSFKGRKIDTDAFIGLSGFGCICVTEPCPCAKTTPLAQAIAQPPTVGPVPPPTPTFPDPPPLAKKQPPPPETDPHVPRPANVAATSTTASQNFQVVSTGGYGGRVTSPISPPPRWGEPDPLKGLALVLREQSTKRELARTVTGAYGTFKFEVGAGGNSGPSPQAMKEVCNSAGVCFDFKPLPPDTVILDKLPVGYDPPLADIKIKKGP